MIVACRKDHILPLVWSRADEPMARLPRIARERLPWRVAYTAIPFLFISFCPTGVCIL
jgi:hypothetical protein